MGKRGPHKKYTPEELKIRARERARERYHRLSGGRSTLRIEEKRKAKDEFFSRDDYSVVNWRKGKLGGTSMSIKDGSLHFGNINYQSKATFDDGVFFMNWLVRFREDEDEYDARKRIVWEVRQRLPFEKYLMVFDTFNGYDDLRVMEFFARVKDRPSEEKVMELYRSTRK